MNLTRYLLFSILFTASLNAYSQKGLYLEPYVGGGIANINNLISEGVIPMSPVIASTAGVNAGYNFGKLHIGVGVALLNSGYRLADNFATYDAYGQLSDSFSFKFLYHHIVVPVTFGSTFHLGKRLSLVPEVSVAPAYCTGQTIRTRSFITHKTYHSANDTFDNVYWHFSFMGMARLSVVHKLNNHVGLKLGVAYTQMLSNLQKGSDYLWLMSVQRQYALTVNAGLVLKL